MKKTRGVLSVVLAAILSLFMVTACGGGAQTAEPEAPSIVGAWDADEVGVSLTFDEGDTGTVSTIVYSWDFTYTFDGETLELHVNESDMDGSGTLDEDGNLVVDEVTFTSVEEAAYTPYALSGGSEADLEGEWVHTSELYTLTFDGSYEVAYENAYDDIYGIGSYGYDGETLVVAIMDEHGDITEYYGEIDSFGDVDIELWGEGGWYELNDGSEDEEWVDASDVDVLNGPEAVLVGTWEHYDTDEYVTFDADGSVTYYVDGVMGYAYPFTYDGETIAFSDYTGYLDSDGDLNLDGVDGWFVLI